MTKTIFLKESYKRLIKPVLFNIDPENIHDCMGLASNFVQNIDLMNNIIEPIFKIDSNFLRQKINNIEFSNPIGIAAGFDYEAKFCKTLKSLGFGFNTIGTVTARYYEGNPKPRLIRLPKSKSILVNKGFKSPGIDNILQKIDNLKFNHDQALGLSIGSSNIDDIDTIDKAIEDYIISFKKAKDKGYIKYFELNISCPNTRLKENFGEFKHLESLLIEINKFNIKKPIYIKLANDLSIDRLNEQLELSIKYNIKGAILSNLLKDRSHKSFDVNEINGVMNNKGNFSGKPVSENANRLIKHAYKNYGKDILIIGCGGIFDAVDAYEKIKSGASLVQLITGMIYEGPQIALEINEGLIKLLKKDGFKNISEAVGIET